MIIIILIALLWYVLPAFLAWLYISLAHYHPRGKWNGLGPDGDDFFWVLLPIANVFFLFAWIIQWPLKKTKNRSSFFKRNWKG